MLPLAIKMDCNLNYNGNIDIRIFILVLNDFKRKDHKDYIKMDYWTVRVCSGFELFFKRILFNFLLL